MQSTGVSEPEITTVPQAQFILIDGIGSPDAYPQYAMALRQLAGVLGVAYGPLEGLWWTEDGTEMLSSNVDAWRWSVMLRLTDPVTAARFKDAVEHAEAKYANGLMRQMRAAKVKEGAVVQMMYTGSLQSKQPALDQMLRYARRDGYEFHGKYHEIYFHDPGPGTPADAQTLLRQPVRKQDKNARLGQKAKSR